MGNLYVLIICYNYVSYNAVHCVFFAFYQAGQIYGIIVQTATDSTRMLLTCICAMLVFCHMLGGAASEFTPTVYSIESTAECGQYHHINDVQLMKKLSETTARLLNQRTYSSCLAWYSVNPSAPSGYYNITAANSSTIQVYCDMEGSNCGGEGGWTRVAYVNMTQPGATCPQGLELRNFDIHKLCSLSVENGCSGVLVSTLVKYSKVCGQVRGYQYAVPQAFVSYNADSSLTINDAYVDGVSITYGNTPRKHVWTYAGGPQDALADSSRRICPCKDYFSRIAPPSIPPYVSTDYYCESGVNQESGLQVLHNDTLWDGQQCGGGEDRCCTHPNMPWFTKTLSETTSEDIELRVCKHSNTTGETPLEVIELFVK